MPANRLGAMEKQHNFLQQALGSSSRLGAAKYAGNQNQEATE
jgi:hypothetical protein